MKQRHLMIQLMQQLKLLLMMMSLQLYRYLNYMQLKECLP
ncbi:hypothetical protein RU99_GL001551 [Enterococcus casseliflavus]|nr:hypothetical protein RU99_GL001551 [Enterococcus casseliflavus]